jgi:hypothetical protein
MSEYTKQALLRRAVDGLGLEGVAVRLKSPASLIEAWLQGQATMPERKYVALVDIVASFIDTPKPKPADK